MLRIPRLNDDDVKVSFRKFLRSPEGALALAALHGVLDQIGPDETCALHAHNARRKFASELIAMAYAAEDPDSSDGADNAGHDARSPRKAGQPRRNRRHGPAGQ